MNKILKNCKNFCAIWVGDGYVMRSNNFDSLAKIIVKNNENKYFGFIFHINMLPQFEEETQQIDKKMLDIIQAKLKSKQINQSIFTYDLQNHSFFEVENPPWWESKKLNLEYASEAFQKLNSK